MWILFTAPCPTPAFFEEWQIDSEPGEIAIVLEGDVGLVPLGGDDA